MNLMLTEKQIRVLRYFRDYRKEHGIAPIDLVVVNLLPAWLVVVMLGRDLYINGIRQIAAERGITLSPDQEQALNFTNTTQK